MNEIEAGVEGEPWTRQEVEVVVADYLHMLRLQLMGQTPNKAEHNRRLQALIPARSKGSIEYKHCNITAVLMMLGYPQLIGYKRRENFQQLLVTVVSDAARDDQLLNEAAIRQVEMPADAPLLDSFDNFVVPVPSIEKTAAAKRDHVADRPLVMRDYLEREAHNRSLGQAGENLVMEYEARRLHGLGETALADRVEHVSRTKGDGAGFDILSFEPGGRERFIEVKTTAYIAETPFYVSRNELSFSTERADQFHLYRLFDFRQQPRMFMLQGKIDSNCTLDPVSYRAALMARK